MKAGRINLVKFCYHQIILESNIVIFVQLLINSYSIMSSNLSFCISDEEINVTHYTKPPNVSVTQNSKVGPR